MGQRIVGRPKLGVHVPKNFGQRGAIRHRKAAAVTGIGVSVTKFYEALHQGAAPPVSRKRAGALLPGPSAPLAELPPTSERCWSRQQPHPHPENAGHRASGFLGRALVARLLSNGENRFAYWRAVPLPSGRESAEYMSPRRPGRTGGCRMAR